MRMGRTPSSLAGTSLPASGTRRSRSTDSHGRGDSQSKGSRWCRYRTDRTPGSELNGLRADFSPSAKGREETPASCPPSVMLTGKSVCSCSAGNVDPSDLEARRTPCAKELYQSPGLDSRVAIPPQVPALARASRFTVGCLPSWPARTIKMVVYGVGPRFPERFERLDCCTIGATGSDVKARLRLECRPCTGGTSCPLARDGLGHQEVV